MTVELRGLLRSRECRARARSAHAPVLGTACLLLATTAMRLPSCSLLRTGLLDGSGLLLVAAWIARRSSGESSTPPPRDALAWGCILVTGADAMAALTSAAVPLQPLPRHMLGAAGLGEGAIALCCGASGLSAAANLAACALVAKATAGRRGGLAASSTV